jgi:hypothetical protein
VRNQLVSEKLVNGVKELVGEFSELARGLLGLSQFEL